MHLTNLCFYLLGIFFNLHGSNPYIHSNISAVINGYVLMVTRNEDIIALQRNCLKCDLLACNEKSCNA